MNAVSFSYRHLVAVLASVTILISGCARRSSAQGIEFANPHDWAAEVSPSVSFDGGAAVDVYSGGLQIEVPIYSARLSDTLSYTLAARYESKLQWKCHPVGARAWLPDDIWALSPDPYPAVPDGRPDAGQLSELGWGWDLSLGRIAFGGQATEQKYVILPDGSVHKLYIVGDNETGDGDGGADRLITRNGSRLLAAWHLNVSSVPGSNDRQSNRIYRVFGPNGVVYEYGHWVGHPYDCGDYDTKHHHADSQRTGWHLTSMGDAHGNRVDIEYYTEKWRNHVIKRIADTAGREITTTLTNGGATGLESVLNSLIESVTYPTQDGTGVASFQYAATSDVVWPPGANLVSPQFTVALLRGITLGAADGSPVATQPKVHKFDYNEHGEVRRHELATGGIVEYAFANYHTYADSVNRALLGRGVQSVRVLPEPTAEPGSWRMHRDKAYLDACGAPQPYIVRVADPLNMWRSYEFVPRPQSCPGGSFIQPMDALPLLHKLVIWDRPVEDWSDWCMQSPSGALPAVTYEQRWFEDNWLLSGAECFNDKSPRVIHSRTSHADGSWQTVDNCGWDEFGHFRHSVTRGWTAQGGGHAIEPVSQHREYVPRVRQWMLDLKVLDETAVGGMATRQAWAYTADGQVAASVSKNEYFDYPPPGVTGDALADYQCDNSSAPVLTRNSSYISPSSSMENRLQADANNWPVVTTMLGPWKHDTSHVFCDGSSGSFRVQDMARLGQPTPPDPLPPLPSPDFPAPPLDVAADPGDVLERFEYYGAVFAHGSNADPHGHASWGQLRRATVSGDDSSRTFVKEFTWACGTAESESWPTLGLYAVDNDIQCDASSRTGIAVARRDMSGVETRFTHDDLGRLVRIEPQPTGVGAGVLQEAPTTIVHGAQDRTKTVIQRFPGAAADEGLESYEYRDGLGRTIVSQTRLSADVLSTRQFRHDALGRVTWQSELHESPIPFDEWPWPHGTTFSYSDVVAGSERPEPMRRLVKQAWADGSELNVSYHGRSVTQWIAGINNDPAQVSRRTIHYDALSRPWHVDAPDDPASPAADAFYEFDVHGEIEGVVLQDPGNPASRQVRWWKRDALGRLEAHYQPETGEVSEMRHDALGNLIAFRDADGIVHSSDYDGASRLVSTGYMDGSAFIPVEFLEYDDPSVPGARGKLTATQTVTSAGAPVIRREYAYESVGARLSSIRYINSTEPPLDCTATLEHDELGLSRRLEYPACAGSSQAPFAVVYDREFGRVQRVGTDDAPSHFQRGVVYHATGAPAFKGLGNGIAEWSFYDSRGRLESRSTGEASMAASYDAVGNLTSFVDLYPMSRTDEFRYDLSGRLKSAVHAGVGEYTMVYDVFGNMVSQVFNNAGACASWEANDFTGRLYENAAAGDTQNDVTNRISHLGIDPACHPSTAVVYDNSGNVRADETAAYAYDVLGRCISRTPHTTGAQEDYLYDTNGWRVATVRQPGAGQEVEHFLRDPDGLLLRDGDTAYVYVEGKLLATRKFGSGGAVEDRWYALDQRDSTRAVLDESGNVVSRHDFAAFGVELPRTNPAPGEARLYAGHLQWGDDSHVYMMARSMSTRHARFLSPDPTPESIAATDPQTWNRYTYCENNPLVNRDPDGKIIETVWDVANIVMGAKSLAQNIASGNAKGAALDALGIVLDAGATAVPGLPGGAGTAIKAARVADKAKDAVVAARAAGNAKDAAGGGAKVFRGLAKGEETAGGLVARNVNAGNSPASHIAGKRDTQWISTTKDRDIAFSKYGEHGVVEIDLSKVSSEVLDVSDGVPGVPPGGMLEHWGRNAQEVLIRGNVPAEAVRRVK